VTVLVGVDRPVVLHLLSDEHGANLVEVRRPTGWLARPPCVGDDFPPIRTDASDDEYVVPNRFRRPSWRAPPAAVISFLDVRFEFDTDPIDLAERGVTAWAIWTGLQSPRRVSAQVTHSNNPFPEQPRVRSQATRPPCGVRPVPAYPVGLPRQALPGPDPDAHNFVTHRRIFLRPGVARCSVVVGLGRKRRDCRVFVSPAAYESLDAGFEWPSAT